MLEKEMQKEIERVTGDVIPTKRPVKHVDGLVKDPEPTTLQKITKEFFEEDFNTVKKSVYADIVKPTIKNLLADIFIGSIERAFFGNSRRGSSPTNYASSIVRTASSVNYQRASQQAAKETPEKVKLGLNDIIMRDRPAAQDLIDILKGEIYDHGQVTIAELYEMLADDDTVTSTNFTDNYYGWKNLDDAYVKPHGRMYRVVLPRPIQLD